MKCVRSSTTTLFMYAAHAKCVCAFVFTATIMGMKLFFSPYMIIRVCLCLRVCICKLLRHADAIHYSRLLQHFYALQGELTAAPSCARNAPVCATTTLRSPQTAAPSHFRMVRVYFWRLHLVDYHPIKGV